MGFKATIYQTLLRYEEGLGGKRKIETGRKAGDKNHVPSSPRVKLTELNLKQGLYAQTFFPDFGSSSIINEL